MTNTGLMRYHNYGIVNWIISILYRIDWAIWTPCKLLLVQILFWTVDTTYYINHMSVDFIKVYIIYKNEVQSILSLFLNQTWTWKFRKSTLFINSLYSSNLMFHICIYLYLDDFPLHNHPFIHPFSKSVAHSANTQSSIHKLNQLFKVTFHYSLTHSFIHSSIRPSNHSFTFIHSFIHAYWTVQHTNTA